MRKQVNRRWLALGGMALMVAVIVLAVVFGQKSAPQAVDLTQILNSIKQGQVSRVEVSADGRDAEIFFADHTKSHVTMPATQPFTELLTSAQIPTNQWPPIEINHGSSISGNVSIFARVGIFLVLGVAVFFLMRRFTPGGISSSNGRRSGFDPVRPGERIITFDDVAGSEEVKEEVADIVDFLRDPNRFRELGARIPRGVLLAGPPGTGKTLIARALAGEARASYFSVSGSEFVELYVGVGASRVRDLFRKAKEASPAIIFIDEIDAIGRRRGRMEQSTEYDQTLNQILVEMDGFEERQTVVVVAATNRIDILDPALIRPGRFDRKVQVGLPDRAARRAILEVHGRGKPFASDVTFDEVAARTTGMSGADLSNVINEAAILAARKRETKITRGDLLEALDRTIAGPAKKTGRFSERERKVIAYHEAGHAVVAHLLPHADVVRKVTIVSRGQAGGYTMIVPEEDRGLWTRAQLTDRLAALLSGMAAEELIFGEITTGSSNDLEQTTAIASSMVQRYGMSRRFGLLSTGNGAGELQLSQRSAFAAEQEAQEIVQLAYDTALTVLKTHSDDLERVTQRLLEVETIEGEELEELIGTPRPLLLPAPRPRTGYHWDQPQTNEPQPRRRALRRVGKATASAAAFALASAAALLREPSREANQP
ncbi:MAG TPA: ATP-dependent zinc metalloprotease FtsH [Thermomicrobiaceae bacterium]|nr:ATP-dependent zinc metalloprotease FtsH [Thermomicrobiaceae bacterium]